MTASPWPPPGLLGEYQGVPKPDKKCNLSSIPGSALGAPAHWTCPKHLPPKGEVEILTRYPKPSQFTKNE